MFRTRRPDYVATPYTSALLGNFGVYLSKVDPTLGDVATIVADEPDYSSLSATALAVVLGPHDERSLRRLSQRTRLHHAFTGGVPTNK